MLVPMVSKVEATVSKVEATVSKVDVNIKRRPNVVMGLHPPAIVSRNVVSVGPMHMAMSLEAAPLRYSVHPHVVLTMGHLCQSQLSAGLRLT